MKTYSSKAPAIWAIVMIASLILTACAPSADPSVVQTAIAQTEGAPTKGSASRELVKATLESATEPSATPEPTAQPTDQAETISALCNDGEILTDPNDTTYSVTCVDALTYDWPYTPGTTKTTPDLRHDAQSTGNGKTVTYDIGVNAGEFGIVTGVEVTIGGKMFGNPCALVALAPGYYYQVTISSGRFEVYYLPNSEPRDPDGWSRVLADQAQQKEHNLYECPNKVLNEIPLLISSVQTGFAP